MKKFLIGLVTGLLLAGLTLLVTLVALLRAGERPPRIAEGSTLVLNLEGEIPERPSLTLPLPMFESRAPATLHEMWDLLRKAAADSRIQAIVLQPRGVNAGWGKLREIRDGLLKFRESGKPLVAFLRNPGARDYYLATAAEHIYMTRDDLLDVKGLRAEVIFLRGTLQKLGVELEIEHAGKYKDAADMFTRTSMRPETREVLNSVLDQIYGELLEAIATSRNMEAEIARAVLNDGPFLGSQALERGLIDKLLFEDEVFEQLRVRLGQEEIRKLSHRRYLNVPATAVGVAGGSRIALLLGEGTIISGGGRAAFGEEGALRSRPFISMLQEIARDDRIRGVILRIDSPGGDAAASDEILREVRLLGDKKPLVISMSDVAASGGYYIAMTGDPIVAYPNTFTGSIGVLYGKLNLRGLYDKLGIQKQILTRGRFADIDSDYEPLSEAARKKLREGVDEVYRNFLGRVAEGRKRKLEEIEPLAQGRVWLGSQARENGLVDELGGLDRAIELVKEKAGIPEQEKIQLVSYPARRSFLQYVFTRSEEPLIGVRLQELPRELMGLPWRRGGILKLMPYTVQVR